MAIYFAADDEADGEQGYEVAGKFIYPAMHERPRNTSMTWGCTAEKWPCWLMISIDGSSNYGEVGRLRSPSPVFRSFCPSGFSLLPGMLYLTGTRIEGRKKTGHEKTG